MRPSAASLSRGVARTLVTFGARRFGSLRCAYLLMLLGVSLAPCNAQISPGPLAKPHQALSGSTQCIKCHEVNTRTPSFKCVQCHTEIAAELRSNHGLHATFPRAGQPGAACVKCHSDHNGANFAMIHWDPTPKGFDHSKTGFMLEGKHSGVECRACHTAKNIAPVQRAKLATKDLNHTWMGLSQACNTCHEDKHNGRFGADCRVCHSVADWKATSINRQSFDHSKTRYPLTGAHRTVDCQKCHTAGADGQPRYAGLLFNTCASCHSDPHKGAFKQTCETCHTTSTWKKSSVSANFDHSMTAFPLLGKHAEVSCVACHKSANFKQPIVHAQCADCHRPDPHSGQFAARADGGKCESCHTVQGWKPSTFTVVDHKKTGFPLVFPHEKVTCAQCHLPAGTQTRFKIAFKRCVDCHKDEHQGQFAAAPWFNACEKCHTGSSFKTANYSLAKHQQSGFPLTGGHMAVACNQCHKPLVNAKLVPYHFAHLSCTTCHEDIHRGQFAGRMKAGDAQSKRTGCEVCHSTKEWQDLARFDHATTKFPLIGSHRAVTCGECHRPPNLERTMIHVDFTSASTACSDCHENPHGNQFGVKARECAGCHNTIKWRPSIFDHDKTVFPLKGGHENVRCSACHVNLRTVEGKEILFYRPTPTACSDCHGQQVPSPMK